MKMCTTALCIAAVITVGNANELTWEFGAPTGLSQGLYKSGEGTVRYSVGQMHGWELSNVDCATPNTVIGGVDFIESTQITGYLGSFSLTKHLSEIETESSKQQKKIVIKKAYSLDPRARILINYSDGKQLKFWDLGWHGYEIVYGERDEWGVSYSIVPEYTVEISGDTTITSLDISALSNNNESGITSMSIIEGYSLSILGPEGPFTDIVTRSHYYSITLDLVDELIDMTPINMLLLD